tara:strand:+ start:5209 stop:5691 length:483 start_codon:yes stop_codon:yes gene_type:complete
MSTEVTSVRCLCGKVELEAVGIPILTTVCHCDGCREAADELEELPGAEPVKMADGGVPYVVYRKDRVICLKGAEHLREHRLKPDSPTRRVVATCCNSFLMLDFTHGHWITLVRQRVEATQAVEAAPHPARTSPMFFVRLFASWLPMGFKTPKIDYVNGVL